MKVSAYYSTVPRPPYVYHDHDNCPNGKQIKESDKRYGTNNWPKCKICIQLG